VHQVTVKLFGTLPRYVPGYDPEKGMNLQLPAGATYGDLLAALGVPERQAGLILARGSMRKLSETVGEGEEVSLFTLVSGG
jgi:sulfur carrier protein ThiS